MKTLNARISHLKEMIVLEEKRTHLLSKIAAVNERLSVLQEEFSSPTVNAAATVGKRRASKTNGRVGAIQQASLRSVKPRQAEKTGTPAHRPSARPLALGNAGAYKPHSKVIRGKIPLKRGELKAQILGALRQAGNSGITIKDLSEKLGAKYKNIYIWFVTTGKRIPGIQKAGPARYKLEPVC